MMKIVSRFDVVGFFSNILAVILGIAITFSLQGIIDTRNQKENVMSALRIVGEELTGCRNDLADCAAFLDKERTAALYLSRNLSQLHSCPVDSVAEYGTLYISEMLLTLPDDALELLKSSSLFSAINDNDLSLAIIRAYDQCNALRQIFNRHEEKKSATLEKIFIEKGVDKCVNPDGSISISELMNNKNGMYLTSQLLSSSAKNLMTGIKDIDTAIKQIDDYLNARK